MRNPLTLMPAGAWVGLVIVGLGAWAQDLFGVVLGGILAVASLVLTDRHRAQQDEAEPGDELARDDRFKDM